MSISTSEKLKVELRGHTALLTIDNKAGLFFLGFITNAGDLERP